MRSFYCFDGKAKLSTFCGICVFLFSHILVADVTLVEEGKPVADIVVSEAARPSVKTAANELQTHLEKISGAKLPIVHAPSENVANHVYVGENEFTKTLGVTLDDVKDDGFKIVAEGNNVVLAGKEIDTTFDFEEWNRNRAPGNRQKAWEKHCGQLWRWPPIHDFREFNKECGFHLKDGTGTLYAVHELLNQLGMRWYMPVREIGIVYPELKTVAVKEQNLKKEPEFPQRMMTDVAGGTYTDEFLWYKSMKVGTAFPMPIYHSLSGPLLKRTMARDQVPTEFFGKVNGKINFHSPKLTSEKLRTNLIEYLEKVDETFPNVPYTCIGQPDGWSAMDEEDVAAGWDKAEERGPRGRFSDYMWDFILDVRKRYEKKHPERKYTVFAYGCTTRPPTNVDKIPDDVSVAFCQSAQNWMLPDGEAQKSYRDEWLEKLKASGADKNQFMIWEYYIKHADRYGFPPVPIIFTDLMKKSFDELYDRCAGYTVEVGWTGGKERARLKRGTRRPGLSHLMLYLHNRLCWDRDLDVDALLDEYYELFFGPAKEEMKEFYEFGEEVWTRPEPRKVTAVGGFLKRDDVTKFFDILKRAKEKAGDTIYGKRVDFIAAEMESLKKLHDKLERKGPTIHGYRAEGKPTIDGNLDEPFWTGFQYAYPLRDMVTGEIPSHVGTNAAFKWVGNDLYVAIECLEPKMDKLNEACDKPDSMDIFCDDTVEILFETPTGTRPKIVVNSAGTVFDKSESSDVTELPMTYSVDDIAVKKLPDRWTVEARINAGKLNGKKPNTFYPWGVNVCRQRMAGNQPEYYMLSPSGTSFKDVQCMGNLMIR